MCLPKTEEFGDHNRESNLLQVGADLGLSTLDEIAYLIIALDEPKEMLTSSATSLMVIRLSFNTIFIACSTFSLTYWDVKSEPRCSPSWNLHRPLPNFLFCRAVYATLNILNILGRLKIPVKSNTNHVVHLFNSIFIAPTHKQKML